MHWPPDYDTDSESSDSESSNDDESDESDSSEGLPSQLNRRAALEVAPTLRSSLGKRRAENSQAPESVGRGQVGSRMVKRQRTLDSKRSKQYPSILDLKYQSIRTLNDLLPGLRNDIFLQDLYKRKQPINRDGVRLQGTQPYDHDENKALHFAETFGALERSDCRYVLLFGCTVQAAFSHHFGVYRSGDERLIGGRKRHVINIPHPEWIKMHSSAIGLRKVREETLIPANALLKSITPLDLDYIDRLIGAKEVSHRADGEDAPQRQEIRLPSNKGMLNAQERLKKNWSDASRRKQSKYMSESWTKGIRVGSESAVRKAKQTKEMQRWKGEGVNSKEVQKKRVAKMNATNARKKRASEEAQASSEAEDKSDSKGKATPKTKGKPTRSRGKRTKSAADMDDPDFSMDSEASASQVATKKPSTRKAGGDDPKALTKGPAKLKLQETNVSKRSVSQPPSPIDADDQPSKPSATQSKRYDFLDAESMTEDELKFHLPSAIDFLGAAPSADLPIPDPTDERPYAKRCLGCAIRDRPSLAGQPGKRGTCRPRADGCAGCRSSGIQCVFVPNRYGESWTHRDNVLGPLIRPFATALLGRLRPLLTISEEATIVAQLRAAHPNKKFPLATIRTDIKKFAMNYKMAEGIVGRAQRLGYDGVAEIVLDGRSANWPVL